MNKAVKRAREEAAIQLQKILTGAPVTRAEAQEVVDAIAIAVMCVIEHHLTASNRDPDEERRPGAGMLQ